jgi:MFS family permease
MSRRAAWGLVALALVLMVSADMISLAGGIAVDVRSNVFIWAIALVFAAAGVLITSRHAGNAIGWLFLGVAVAAGIGTLAGSYAEYWVDSREGSEWLGKTAAWYGSLSWMPFILVPATFLLLLFPNGRLLSPRWRVVAWCAGVGIAATFVLTGLHPGRLEDYPELSNPYGVESSALDGLELLSVLVLLIGIFGSALSLVLRFRRARGEQRQQMKWLAFAGAVASVAIPTGAALYDVVGETAANITIMLSVIGLPVATGIAILRHRLYDIDVVINRALVYGALTATLAGAYVGVVLLLQLLLSPSSDIAIAGSTLAVAALFRPARTRIQAGVDRRFYRSRYDARRTLESFSVRLRDEVALDALSIELRGVVVETMQPAHVSLWLRPSEAQR